MHGIGNDFVMVDAVRNSEVLAGQDLAELARGVCDRRRGVGADGLILLDQVDRNLRMRMFNPDGSESEMCGNGLRCFARYAVREGYASPPSFSVATGAGLLEVELVGDEVTVDMGIARLTRGEIGMAGASDETFVDQPIPGSNGRKGTAVSMGNPHLVLFVDDPAKIDLAAEGPQLERHALFPERTNVHFIQILDREHLVQRTWERGAGETQACGTGACASGVAAHLTGRADSSVEIALPGGRLHIQISEDRRVHMTGPAVFVFEAEWPL